MYEMLSWDALVKWCVFTLQPFADGRLFVTANLDRLSCSATFIWAGYSDGDQFSWAVYSRRHSNCLIGASFRNSSSLSSTISSDFLSASQILPFGHHPHYNCGASSVSGSHGVATFARRGFVEDRCDRNDPHHVTHSQLHANTNFAAGKADNKGSAMATVVNGGASKVFVASLL